MKAAPIGPTNLRSPAPREPMPLPRPAPAQPGEPLVCGEYGPRFVGYGPEPQPSLAQRAAPWLLGGAVCVAALAIEYLMGRL
jgi:hypothetical protein